MKKSLTFLFSLAAAGILLTGCGGHRAHHVHHHVKTTAVKSRKSAVHHESRRKKMPKANRKDMNKSGLSNSDIKKDSRAINKQKSNDQPVD